MCNNTESFNKKMLKKTKKSSNTEKGKSKYTKEPKSVKKEWQKD